MRNKFSIKMLFVLFVICFMGYVTTAGMPKSVIYNSAQIYSPTDSNDIKIFRATPPQQHTRIGEIEYQSSNYGDNLQFL